LAGFPFPKANLKFMPLLKPLAGASVHRNGPH
jgi:hypothetical protein